MKRQLYILMSCSVLCVLYWQSLAAQQSNVAAEFEKLFSRGVDNLQENELQTAINVCRDFIKQYDKNADKQTMVAKAHLMKGQILRRQDYARLDIVIGELRNGLRRDSTSSELNRELGIALKDMEKFDESRSYLDEAVKLNPKDRLAWQGLIELNDKHNNSEQKISAYQGYLSVDPTNAGIWIKLGDEYLKVDNTQEAKNSFVKALKQDGHATSARLQLALLKEKEGKWADAIAEYNAILRYDQSNVTATDRLNNATPNLQKEQKVTKLLDEGKTALKSKDPKQWEQAIQDFDSLLVSDPQNLEAIEGFRDARKKLYEFWFSEGLRDESKNSNQALDAFTESLAYADSDEERERAFEKQKQTAFKLGKKIVAKDAKEAAQLAMKTRKFGEALKKFTVASDLDPSLDPEIRPGMKSAELGDIYQRGIAAFDNGKYELAKSYFDLVKRVNPEFQEVQRYYAEAERQVSISFLVPRYQSAMTKQDWLSARSYLRELIALAPNNAQYVTDLKTVESEIRSAEREVIARIVLWGVGGVMVLFLLWHFRGMRVRIFCSLLEGFKWLIHRKLLAAITILLFSCLIVRFLFWTFLLTNLPGIMKWADSHEGFLALIGLLIGGAWTIFFFAYKSYQGKKNRKTANLI